MSAVPSTLRRMVIDRAGAYCEYCGLAQRGQAAAFHLDHVVPSSLGGLTSEENLAFANCSLRKGDRTNARDPESGERVPLFNPRTSKWPEHFRWTGLRIEGLTATGRATVAALRMNQAHLLLVREEQRRLGRYPPFR